MALTADGALLYVTDNLNDRVTAISTDDHSVVAQIPVGNAPSGVAITPP
jgi:YVTN family beta-propeller protein